MTARERIPWLCLLALFRVAAAAASLPTGPVRAIACAPSHPDTAAALIGNAVWLTLDRGATWTESAVLPGQAEPGDGARSAENAEDSGDGDSDSREPEIRLREESLEETRPGGEEGPAPESTGPGIAVGDSGIWAAHVDGRLFIGGPAPGVVRRLARPGVRGLVVDPENRLWASARDAVFFYGQARDGQGGERRFSLPGAGVPVAAAWTGALLVPARSGIWTAGSERPGGEPSLRLLAAGRAEAVAAVARDGRIYGISGARLRQWSPESRDLGPSPRASRLAIDRVGRFFADTGKAGWFVRVQDQWRPVRARDVAVDAEGGTWLGTDLGPVPPGSARTGALADPLTEDRFGAILSGAELQLARFPGKPRCRWTPFNPLPRAEAVARLGNGIASRRQTLPAQIAGNRQGGFFVGLRLTWRFDPLRPQDCIADARRWYALRERRARELEALWVSWMQAGSPTPGDGAGGADQRLQREKIAELIREKSGVDPAGEER